MNGISDLFNELLGAVPLYAAAAAAGLLMLLSGILIAVFRRGSLLKAAVGKMSSGKTDSHFAARLLARPGLIEVLMRRKGEEVISFFGIAGHLVNRFERRKRSEDARRLLKLAPAEGLYAVFNTALRKESVAQVLRNWIKDNKDVLLLRKMALSASGRDFDGIRGLYILSGCLEEIRELSGDPEWPVRFFSLRILLADDDPKSKRLVSEGFTDPHPLIRRTVARENKADNLDVLFGSLMTMVLDDPVPEVRQSARERIDSTFPDRWKLDPSGMNALQSVHVLELLKTGSKEDENVAITALKSPSAEARLAAARFLEKSGTLKKIFGEANLGDREDWERRKYLLSRAVSVGISGFLEQIRFTDSVDTLLLGARLLGDGGDPSLIAPLSEKAFNRSDPTGSADEVTLYRTAINLACERGDQKARQQVAQELRNRKGDPDVLGFILPLLPPGEAAVFRDVMLEFLKDPDFPADDAYLSLMAMLPPSLFLGPVLDILEADRSSYSYRVRLRALRTLTSWHLGYTLQTILENLPLLPKDQTRIVAGQLAEIDKKAFDERAAFILSTPDAGIRASLISCLPVTSLVSFSREIKEGLNDADPDMRIACLRALLDAGDLKATGPALSLLKDPVEKVRLEAARIAGIKGSDKFLESLENLLRSPEESVSVREAALEGLAAGSTPESVAVMIRFLDTGTDLRKQILKVMSSRTDRKSIIRLIEHFKDSEAVLREKISDVFTAMGTKGEESLVELLKENIASIQPFIADILTRTGYVEVLIRKLGHRKPDVRREAAELLAEIATESAFRGIVLAARDPDRDVRIRVTKALESLGTAGGESILSSLEKDPDRKVRKYTHWAMERLKAKKLP
jgi:HEAT repeat protein